jgi:hypothetical protein
VNTISAKKHAIPAHCFILQKPRGLAYCSMVATAETPIVRKGIARRISPQDVEAIAELVGKRLTETEACAALGIKYLVWLRWKNRAKNTGRFDAVLTQVKGNYLRAQIQNIEAGAIGAGNHKRADWRASRELISLVSPERYAQQAAPDTSPRTLPAPTVNVWVSGAYQVASAVADASQANQIVDVQAKLIADKPEEKCENSYDI